MKGISQKTGLNRILLNIMLLLHKFQFFDLKEQIKYLWSLESWDMIWNTIYIYKDLWEYSNQTSPRCQFKASLTLKGGS